MSEKITSRPTAGVIGENAASPSAATAAVETNAARKADGGSDTAQFDKAAQSDRCFTPLLSTYDWNEEWKELQKRRKSPDDASFWDKRSATFSTKDAPNPYVERFLELAAIKPGETVFDMGCGTGALTIPLAQSGHSVIAADFSSGMLSVLRSELDSAPTPAPSGSVRLLQMSWSDPWDEHGVTPESADVALASRSIATADIRDSLLRLTEVARRRICITLSTGSSPRSDETLLAELGLVGQAGRDYLYAFNILANEGLFPEVSYIQSVRKDTFDTKEEAWESFSRMIDSALRLSPAGCGSPAKERQRQAAYGRLREWLEANLVPNPDAGKPDRKGIPQGKFKTTRPRMISWAFIAWNK
ncbi:MAG TPA: methyltransferase domain-containing protein [Candidatus Aphodovivens excrementavium]|nr:methyltransferase domain-containing protein [Candidatus Aphodovivens excrementavium]